MFKFRISDIREVFSRDLMRLCRESCSHLEALVTNPGMEGSALSEATRHAHTLKGLAATVEAWGLSEWGADVEFLLEFAERVKRNAPETSSAIFNSLLACRSSWEQMNDETTQENFDSAWETYLEARSRLCERWAVLEQDRPIRNRHVPTSTSESPEAVAPAAVFQPVASSGSSVSSSFSPVGSSFQGPPRVLPPRLKRSEAPTAHPQTMPGAPLASSTPARNPEMAPKAFRAESAESRIVPPPVVSPEKVNPPRADFRVTGTSNPIPSVAPPALRRKGSGGIPGGVLPEFGAKAPVVSVVRPNLLRRGLTGPGTAGDSSPAPHPRISPIPRVPKVSPQPVTRTPAKGATWVDSSLVGFFIQDATVQTEMLEQAALRWERNENPTEQVVACQRAFHTLKGAANSIGLRSLGESVHQAESLMEVMRSGEVAARPSLFAFLFRSVDQLRSHLRELAQQADAPWGHEWTPIVAQLRRPIIKSGLEDDKEVSAPDARQEATPTSVVDETQFLRIESTRLHQIITLIGETVVQRSRSEKRVGKLTALQHELRGRGMALGALISSFQQQFEFTLLRDKHPTEEKTRQSGASGSSGTYGSSNSDSESEFSELEFDRYDQFSILARSLIEISHDLQQLTDEAEGSLEGFVAENQVFQQTVRQLQERVVSLSLVPISTLYPRLERAFRDALTQENKEATLVLEGENTLIDKTLVDRLYGPLMHLLRNAVSHGLEDTSARQSLGKNETGEIRIETEPASSHVVIRISDDGRGVNLERIRDRAVEKGWIVADVQSITLEQAAELIFQPGFSTAETVTNISGRGIGLDVVRQEIQSLNGTIELASELGRGVMWTIRLPLNLSISEAVMAVAGGRTFAFPLNGVDAGVLLEASALEEKDGGLIYRIDQTELPFCRLTDILQIPPITEPRHGVVLIAGDRRMLFAVDEVVDRQEIVVKQLDELLARHPLLNGATIDSEGLAVPILNPTNLIKLAQRATTPSLRQALAKSGGIAASVSQSHPQVLIVDDSLSVRKVLERQLQGFGCDVVAAIDGLNALDALRERTFDIVFTDLEMPGLNGYELTTEIRGNPSWSMMPVVVVSSRNADKYVTKAMTLGATSFLGKPFTGEQLVDVLRHYLKWDSINQRWMSGAQQAVFE